MPRSFVAGFARGGVVIILISYLCGGIRDRRQSRFHYAKLMLPLARQLARVGRSPLCARPSFREESG